MTDIFSLKLSNKEIEDRRSEISAIFMRDSENIKTEKIATLTVDDLSLLFRLYEDTFLEHWFDQNYKGKIKFTVSRQLTRSAGLTRCPKNISSLRPEDVVIEIKVGIDFFLNFGLLEGRNMVGGIEAASSLEALLLVFEHELCHVIEFVAFGRSSCKGKRFKTMASNLFGHKESYHKLPTHRQIALDTMGLKLGDSISFIYEGKKLTGVLYGINKRATVMVRDNKGLLADRQGKRYTKYYVPLSLIE